MKKQLGKVFIMLFSVICLAACSNVCKTETCQNMPLEGEKYCAEHICAEENCSNERIGENFCKAHFKCKEEYCKDERILNSTACAEHSKASSIEEVEMLIDKMIASAGQAEIKKYKDDFSDAFTVIGEDTELVYFDIKEDVSYYCGEFIVHELDEATKEEWNALIATGESGFNQVPNVMVVPRIDFGLFYNMRIFLIDEVGISDGENYYFSNLVSSRDVDTDIAGMMAEIGTVALCPTPIQTEEKECLAQIFQGDRPLKIRFVSRYTSENIDFLLDDDASAQIRATMEYYFKLKELCNQDAVYFVF